MWFTYKDNREFRLPWNIRRTHNIDEETCEPCKLGNKMDCNLVGSYNLLTCFLKEVKRQKENQRGSALFVEDMVLRTRLHYGCR